MEQIEWINYTRCGEGAPVILLHGLAASRYDWVWLSPELEQAGFRTYMPDLMGHGDSIKPQDPGLYTVETIYRQLEEWMSCLPETEPMTIIGHSLGGHLGLLLAHRRPEMVRSLILIDPFYSQEQLQPGLRLINRYPRIGARGLRIAPSWLVNGLIGLDPWTTNNFPAEIRGQIVYDYLRASPLVMYIPATTTNLSNLSEEVRQPTMIVWGERDFTLSPHSFPRLVKRMPNAIGRSIANCGHQPHLSRPDKVNPWILDFLSSSD
jgi:2-hydroxy-6-oxonona-2,4-dienedioate hydrolase